MKKNQFNEAKGLSIKELLEKVAVIKKEIAEAVMDKNMNKLKDLKTISKKKKDLAQTLTVLKQKQELGQLESKVAQVEKPGTAETQNKKQKTQRVSASRKTSASSRSQGKGATK